MQASFSKLRGDWPRINKGNWWIRFYWCLHFYISLVTERGAGSQTVLLYKLDSFPLNPLRKTCRHSQAMVLLCVTEHSLLQVGLNVVWIGQNHISPQHVQTPDLTSVYIQNGQPVDHKGISCVESERINRRLWHTHTQKKTKLKRHHVLPVHTSNALLYYALDLLEHAGIFFINPVSQVTTVIQDLTRNQKDKFSMFEYAEQIIWYNECPFLHF